MQHTYSFLKADQIAMGKAVLEQHARGESYDEAHLPDVVLYPESTADVQRIMHYAHEHHIPVTPVAANSSLEGHTVPLYGGISLDMTRMNRMISVHPEDLLVVLQPAATYPQVNEHVKRHGLFFPIDPGAHASIGGMLSTNASGTAAVRYGVTGDYIMALEVVTPTGKVIRTGNMARKSSSGYNLLRLYCGSEGTLGVITEITLRLVGLPEAACAARVPFATAEQATAFVTNVIQAGVPVARCELVDPQSIRAVNLHQNTTYPEQTTIFMEFHGNPAGIESDIALAQELAQDQGASAFEASSDPAERHTLWEARHNLYYACVAANNNRRNISTDLAVPISKLPTAIERSLAMCKEAGFNAYLAGHVGDGNFHLLIFFDDDEYDTLKALNHELVMLALELGGTATGEHGIGLRKLRYMSFEHGESLAVMRTLKQVLDPHNIMNPGKKIPLKEVEAVVDLRSG